MATNEDFSAFRQLELAGWDAKAGAYGDHAAKITRQLVNALLDEGAVMPSAQVLDVASGPGYVAGAAAARGAKVVGLDFAPAMVAEARRNFPEVDFREGDAQSLPFPTDVFDAVICAFGLGHMSEPDRAIGEAFRVLKPGGRYVFSWWCSPEKHAMFGLLLKSIQDHGDLNAPLPPAPPVFRFSEPEECKRAMSAAQFTDIRVTEHALVQQVTNPVEVLDLIYRSTVRTAMLLEAQSEEARRRIESAIVAAVERHRAGPAFRLAWPANVVSAKKPAA